MCHRSQRYIMPSRLEKAYSVISHCIQSRARSSEVPLSRRLERVGFIVDELQSVVLQWPGRVWEWIDTSQCRYDTVQLSLTKTSERLVRRKGEGLGNQEGCKANEDDEWAAREERVRKHYTRVRFMSCECGQKLVRRRRK